MDHGLPGKCRGQPMLLRIGAKLIVQGSQLQILNVKWCEQATALKLPVADQDAQSSSMSCALFTTSESRLLYC